MGSCETEESKKYVSVVRMRDDKYMCLHIVKVQNKNSPEVLLHHGPVLPHLRHHPRRVHTANTQFRSLLEAVAFLV